MHLFAAFAALGLLVVVLFPFVSARLRAARRGRAVHLGGSCHWYANYDDELRYEPKRRSDIVCLTRSDLLARGYRPTEDLHLVPRTFRRRVPGDRKIRLWRSRNDGAPALWLCEWAADPVRVAIGVGERERVPGVESVPVPDDEWDEQADCERKVFDQASGFRVPPAPESVPASSSLADATPEDGREALPVVESNVADDEVSEEAGVEGVPASGERGRKRRRRRK